jgi:uncharacterized membrane protein
MPMYLLAFLIGVVAGLRSLTPPAAVSWAARVGWLHLENTPLAFFGFAATPYILSLLAIVELINDKLPKTPSRKAPAPFAFRVVVGALCGAALGAPGGNLIAGLLAGALGGVAGTLGGYEFRSRLVKATGREGSPHRAARGRNRDRRRLLDCLPRFMTA